MSSCCTVSVNHTCTHDESIPVSRGRQGDFVHGSRRAASLPQLDLLRRQTSYEFVRFEVGERRVAPETLFDVVAIDEPPEFNMPFSVAFHAFKDSLYLVSDLGSFTDVHVDFTHTVHGKPFAREFAHLVARCPEVGERGRQLDHVVPELFLGRFYACVIFVFANGFPNGAKEESANSLHHALFAVCVCHYQPISFVYGSALVFVALL